MASLKTDHAERTACEPRDSELHPVVLVRVEAVGATIRLFRLQVDPSRPIKVWTPSAFLPGQWLDVFVPGIPSPGGFTITSPPSKATGPTAYLELAVQDSPANPPAAWLWRPESQILGSTLHVRIGGSFVWPPEGVDCSCLRRVVFVAGGVGINPLMSMLSHLSEDGCSYEVHFLYSVRITGDMVDPKDVLFLDRLVEIFAGKRVDDGLRLFFTGGSLSSDSVAVNGSDVQFHSRRISLDDLEEALGPKEDRLSTVVFVCGVPVMTDTFVVHLTSADNIGLDKNQVKYEKWW